jgi:hypothetical protein
MKDATTTKDGLRQSRVLGLAIGNKRVRKREFRKPCIVVFVTEKLPRNQIAPDRLIPDTVKGIPTDVVALGTRTAQALVRITPAMCQAFHNPLGGGTSLTLLNKGTLGTLTCPVKRRRGKSHSGLFLTANHVVAMPGMNPLKGDLVYHPHGYLSSGEGAHYNGQVIDSIPIGFDSSSKATSTDAALVEFPEANERRMAIGVKILNSPQRVSDPRTKVSMIGAYSGIRHGRVCGRVLDSPIHFEIDGRKAWVKDVLLCESTSRSKHKSFAAAGDSGGIVFLSKGRIPIGMVIAQWHGLVVVAHIDAALDGLGVEL